MLKPAVFVAWCHPSSNEGEECLISNLLLTIRSYHYTSNKLAKSSGEYASNKTLIYTPCLTQKPQTFTILPGQNAMRQIDRLGAEVFARLLITWNHAPR
jgi:hypothetical protein